jgi:site-specific recombinase XerD
MKSANPSELGRTFQSFVAWARAMGWRYNAAPYHLANFACFLERRGIERLVDVDAELLLAYRRDLLATRSPSTVNSYLKTLRALWRYLQREDFVTHQATKGLTSLRSNYFIPYLYASRELLSIEAAAHARIGQARTRAARFSRQTRRAAFNLLRDCGLRVSEACRLNVDDYDPVARSLRIERTKFFKTRTIPLPRTTCTQLGQYLRHRRLVAAETGEPIPFFISIRGRRLHRASLENDFKRLLCSLGLYQPRYQQGRTVFGSTNLHALRHSYAVGVLTRWQRQKRNVERLLPLLSAYLGHAEVTYTKHYLHLTPTLRQLASERFGETVLPRLDGYATLINDE